MNQPINTDVWKYHIAASLKSQGAHDLINATAQSERALNEARRLLGHCWQKPMLSKTALYALTQASIRCCDLMIKQGNTEPAETHLLDQMESLSRIIVNGSAPLMLRFQVARNLGSLLGEHYRRFSTCPEKNSANVSRAWLVRAATIAFWQGKPLAGASA